MNITETYRQGLQYAKQNKSDKARDCFDSIIGYLAHLSLTEELQPTDVIEKATKDAWLDRCWGALESNKLMLV